MTNRKRLDIRLHFVTYVSAFCALWFVAGMILYYTDTFFLRKWFHESDFVTAAHHRVDKDLVLRYLLISASVMSLLGDCLICLHFLFGKDKFARSLQTKMVALISVTDVLRSIGFLMSLFRGRKICEAQAALIQFSSLASILWNNCYCCFMYIQFHLMKRSSKSLLKCSYLFHLFCWTLPTVSIILGFYFKLNGPSDASWCWISHGSMRFVFFYIPLTLVLLFNIAAQVVVFISGYRSRRRFSHNLDEEGSLIDFPESELSSLITWQLRLFIVALILTWGIGLAKRIVSLFQDFNSPYTLEVLSTFILPLNGFFNFVAYFISTKGRVLDYTILHKCFSCCCRAKEKTATYVSEDTITTREESSIEASINTNLTSSSHMTESFRLYGSATTDHH